MKGGRLLFLLFFLLAGGAVTAEDPASSRPDLYYGLGKGSYLAGDLGGARRAALEALKVDPEHRPAMALLARIRLDEDRPAEALELTTELVGAEPDNHEYRLLHALVLHRTGNAEGATEQIDTVLTEAAPDSPRASTARQLRGLQHMARGNWAAAAEVLGEEPGDSTAGRILAGEASAKSAAEHEARGAFSEARVALDTAIALAPDNAPDHLNRLLLARARLHGNRGRLSQAIEDLEQITRADADHLEATVMLVSLYATEERWEAVEGLLPRLSAEPQFRDIVLYFEGRSAFSRGRIGTARAHFEETMDLLEGSESSLLPALHFYRGACLLQLGRSEEGEAEILAALEDGFVLETTNEGRIAGAALLKAGRPADAVDLLEPVAFRHPDGSAAFWIVLGRAQEASGEPALALSAYTQAVSLDPGSVQARARRAAARRSQGDLQGAVADYSYALENEPDNPALAYAFGLTLFQSGRIPEAERYLGQAARAMPGNGAMQLLHALCAFAVGEHASAGDSLERHGRARTDATVNASALLLRYCLDLAGGQDDALKRFETAVLVRQPPDPGLELMAAFFKGRLGEDQALHRAARGSDLETASRGFAETAFWMAQHELLSGDEERARRLLGAVAGAGNPDLPEVRIAAWMLKTGYGP